MFEKKISQAGVSPGERLAGFEIHERHQDAFRRISEILSPHAVEMATVYLEQFWTASGIQLNADKRAEQIERTAAYSRNKYTPPIDADWIARAEAMGRLQFKLGSLHHVHLGALNRSHRRAAQLIFAGAVDEREGSYLVEQFMRVAALEAEVMVSTVQAEESAQYNAKLERNASEFQSSISRIVAEANRESSLAHEKAGQVSEASERLLILANAVASGSVQSTDAMTEAARMSAGLNETIRLIDREMESTLHDLSELAESAEETIASARQLDQHEKSIERIVAMIRDIAEDTSILALNAIIEAAGAGEASVGFTVVANEMKELANQTGKATREIQEQLGGIGQTSRESTASHQAMLGKFLLLRDKASTLRATLSEQAASVGAIASCIDETALSARESTQSLTEINQRTGSVSRDIGDVTSSVAELDKRLQDLRHSAGAFLADLQR